MNGPDKVRTIDDDRLSMISRMSQAVVDIPKQDMNIIKTFHNPPNAIKDTLQAVAILLDMEDISWKAIRKHMAKLSDASLQKMIQARDPECITPEQRKRANVLLAKQSHDIIRNCSAATVSIYEWAKAVAEDE